MSYRELKIEVNICDLIISQCILSSDHLHFTLTIIMEDCETTGRNGAIALL